MKNEKQKVIVIVGPTASGKTAVSIELAKKINGEIISADSMQVYKCMDIGTAKPSIDEQDGIKHYLLDIVYPYELFNVAKYKELATNAIEEILKKKKIPIIVGGTGLYINTLVNGIEFIDINKDEEYTKQLMNRYENEGAESLFEELLKIDPESANVIEKNNIRRVIRALEIYKVTGKTKSQIDKESIKETKYDYRIFGIEWDRNELYDRINSRVDLMFQNGLVDEVKSIIQEYDISNTAIQGLGYKEVIEYLNGNIQYDEMVDLIKRETRHYAKRQLTWFKRDKRIEWVRKEEAVDKIVNSLLPS